MMKPMSGDKVSFIGALVMKGKSARVLVAKLLGLLQITVNRVKKEHCAHL